MDYKSIPEQFFKNAKENSEKIAFEYRLRRSSPYKNVTWGDSIRMINEVAFGLKHIGLKKGDNVAILSGTRYEWAITDLAVLSSAAVVVPLYPTLGDHAVNYILNNSECKYVFLEDKGQLQKIRAQWGELPHIKYAIVYSDMGDLPGNDQRIITYKELKDFGKLSFARDPYYLENTIKSIDRQSVASIIYTSGTTGNPKGVVLTHGNILSVVGSIKKALPIDRNDKFLSFLPLSHVFERVGGLHFALSNCSPIIYCSSIDQIGSSLKDSGATIMLVVPRILEKIYSKVNSSLQSQVGFKKKLIQWGMSVGKALFSNDKKNIIHLALLKTQYKLASLLVLSKIKKSIAPDLKYFISGGAPLSREIAEFFCVLGLKVLEGYGLTETSAPATVNRLNKLKLGSVGLPLENVDIKIAADGEILIKGPSVFTAYYKNPDATNEALKEGWFYTGDVGSFDKEGFLKITDRKKDLIINSAGKNIAPQNIENALKTSNFISNAVVIGDKRKYLSALVTLDNVEVQKYVNEHGLSNRSANFVNDSKIINLIDEEIKVKIADFADYEQIRKFTILENDFTIESGELTPTLKVKRKFVEQKYKPLIDAMYPTD